MDITKTELLEKYAIREDGLEFQPTFTFDNYIEYTQTYENITIIKTAEEVKDNYDKLNNAQ